MRRSAGVLLLGAAVTFFVGIVGWRVARAPTALPAASPLSSTPSSELSVALRGERIPLEAALVGAIERAGRLLVSVHVGLAERGVMKVAPRFGRGDDPSTNLCWGALYGVETHLVNAAGWRRVHVDGGDGRRILRRLVLGKRVTAGPGWIARGVERDFEILLLACAWSSADLKPAMEAPLREAMRGEPAVVVLNGEPVDFGAEGLISGYVGPNLMDRGHWDAFAGIGPSLQPQQRGVFYACSHSAAHLYEGVVEHGLYPVLFTRTPIVPEGYIIEGILAALETGELGDGFTRRAGEAYAQFQKGYSVERARWLFYR